MSSKYVFLRFLALSDVEWDRTQYSHVSLSTWINYNSILNIFTLMCNIITVYFSQVFVNSCLRIILNIHWPEVISNEELWRRAEDTEIYIQIKRRKWNWIGHTLRKGHDIIEREVLEWNPQGWRKRGRPKQMWRRSVHNEALGEGKSWGEVKQLARNRIRWRRFVDALCP